MLATETGPSQAGAAAGNSAPTTSNTSITSSRVDTRSDVDFWADLGNSVRAIIGAEGGRNVIVNPQSGLVVVRAFPVELRQVDEFLNAMEGVVARQVMLEAKIIEVTLRDGFATGINWAAFAQGDNSRFAGGTISPGTDPSRVIKGKKMPGQYGTDRHTQVNLRVEKIDTERHLIYIRGAIAGPTNGIVLVRSVDPGQSVVAAFQAVTLFEIAAGLGQDAVAIRPVVRGFGISR